MRKIKGSGLKANTLKSMLKSTYDRSQVEGWNKVMDTPELSAFEHPSGQVVIAIRGTEGTLKDWSNNAVFGIGGEMAYKLTPRYRRAKERVAELEKRYNPEDITLIGHSQGALLAETVPTKAREIISLNSASRPQDMFYNKKKKNLYRIRAKLDPVSMFNISNPEYTINEKNLNPLAQHSYEVLEGQKVYGDAKYANGIRQAKRAGSITVRSYPERKENQFVQEVKPMF